MVKNAVYQNQPCFVNYMDCAKFANHLGSVEHIQTLQEYLEMHYSRTKMHGSQSILILDNLNCICPLINKDSPPNLLETIKSEKFKDILVTWIEKQEVVEEQEEEGKEEVKEGGGREEEGSRRRWRRRGGGGLGGGTSRLELHVVLEEEGSLSNSLLYRY